MAEPFRVFPLLRLVESNHGCVKRRLVAAIRHGRRVCQVQALLDFLAIREHALIFRAVLKSMQLIDGALNPRRIVFALRGLCVALYAFELLLFLLAQFAR